MTDRKARLAALAARAGRNQQEEKQESPNQKEEASQDDEKPQDRTHVPSSGEQETTPVAKRLKTSEEASVLQQALAKAKEEASFSKENLASLKPKSINWDLKRDIEPKLDKLERRTQRAIVELLRERLKIEAEREESDLD